MATTGQHHSKELTSALIARLRNGEEVAFTNIYEHYHERLFFFAKRFVGEVAEAEDITAETFIKLWNRRQQFNELSAIESFLHTTVRNRCYDYLRHLQVRQQHNQALMKTLEESTVDDLTDQLIQLELMSMIYEAAEKLPRKMRTIFLLSYKEGLKPAQIAAQLEISVQTVMNQRITAIRLLQAALKHQPLVAGLLFILETDGHHLS